VIPAGLFAVFLFGANPNINIRLKLSNIVAFHNTWLLV